MATASYRTRYCRQCVNAGAKGYSLTAFAGMLGVSRQTLDLWAERHPQFAEAIGAHEAKRAKFWEDELARIARDGGKTGSTSMVMFALKSVASEDYGALGERNVLRLHMPMPHRFLAPQQVIMHFKVPGIFRLGGLDIRRPGAVRYMDGI